MDLNHNLQSLPKSKAHREAVTSDCTQKEQEAQMALKTMTKMTKQATRLLGEDG